MTFPQQAAVAENEKEASRAQQNERLMETLHIMADGGSTTRELLNSLLSQYSWDGYINELEFE